MHRIKIIPVICLMTLLNSGCFLIFGDNCHISSSDYTIGELYDMVELQTNKSTLQVGDKFRLKFKMPRYLTDVNGKEMDINQKVVIFNKITTTDDPNDTTSVDTSNFFAIGKTIFESFEEYFDIKVKIGKKINPYTFEAKLKDDYWEVEVEYTAKKAENYWARISFDEIQIDCKSTKSFGAHLYWKPDINNRIDYLFQASKEDYPEYYGFIVEN